MLVYRHMAMNLRRPSAAPGEWLSITPEPERLLPCAVATLVAGGPPPPAAVARERARVDAVVRRARHRAWAAYLRRARGLAEARREAADPCVASARRLAVAVIDDHDNLLLGLRAR